MFKLINFEVMHASAEESATSQVTLPWFGLFSSDVIHPRLSILP
jgi:hypothetical protein